MSKPKPTADGALYIEKQIDLSYDFIKFLAQLFVLLISAYVVIFTGLLAFETSDDSNGALSDMLHDVALGLTIGLVVVGWVFFGLVVKAAGRLSNSLAYFAPNEESLRLANIKTSLLWLGFLFSAGLTALLLRISLFIYSL